MSNKMVKNRNNRISKTKRVRVVRRTRRPNANLVRAKKTMRNNIIRRRPRTSYQKAPTSLGFKSANKSPQYQNERGGMVLIEHTEFVSDIAGNVAFTNVPYAVNPGLPQLFPWLAAISQNYETYDFIRLDFIFKPTTSTSTGGYVIYSIDYDAGDPLYSTKQQAMQGPSKDVVSWRPMVYSCDSQNLHKLKQRYIRVGALSANQDIKTYDTGNFQLIVGGQPNSDIIGELHVHYVVRLMTPQLSTGSTNSEWSSQSYSGSGADSSSSFGTEVTNLYNVQELEFTPGVSPGVVTAQQSGNYLTNILWVGGLLFGAYVVHTNGGSILNYVKNVFTTAGGGPPYYQNADQNITMPISSNSTHLPAITSSSTCTIFSNQSNPNPGELVLNHLNLLSNNLIDQGKLEIYVSGLRVKFAMVTAKLLVTNDRLRVNYLMNNLGKHGDNVIKEMIYSCHPMMDIYLYEHQGKFLSMSDFSSKRRINDLFLNYQPLIDIEDLDKLTIPQLQNESDDDCSQCLKTYDDCECFIGL